MRARAAPVFGFLVARARPRAMRFTERSAGFRAYEEKTTRVIPVFELTRL